MQRPLVRPSHVAFATLLGLFLALWAVAPLFGPSDVAYQRGVQPMPYPAFVRGADFYAPYLAVRRLVRGEPIYLPSASVASTVYNYVPQSLALLLPCLAFDLDTAISVVVVGGFAAMLLLYVAVRRRLDPGSTGLAVLQFPVFALLSMIGILLFDRANLDVIGQTLVLAACVLLLEKRYAAMAAALGLASCLKPFYAPYLCLLLLLPNRWRNAGIYAGVHAVALLVVFGLAGTPAIVGDYLANLPLYVAHQSSWYGPLNNSIPSAIAYLSPALEHQVMTSGASLVTLAALLGVGALVLGAGALRRVQAGGIEARLAFAFLSYVTVLWQCQSASYGALLLVLLLPILDDLAARASTRRESVLILAQAVALGLFFGPPELVATRWGAYAFPYLFAAFACFIAMLVTMRTGRAASI